MVQRIQFLFLALAAFLFPFFAGGRLVADCESCERGDLTRFDDELNERDFDLLRQYINSKRCLDLEEKSYNLTISGDVRTEWRYLSESLCHRSLRGGGGRDFLGIPFGHNVFDVELNLRFDYISENAWAVAHLLFDNSAGVDCGLPCRCGARKQRRREDCDGERDWNEVERLQQEDDREGICICRHRYPKRLGRFLRCCDPNGWQGSGTRGEVNLRKAYLGFNLYDDCGMRFDVEIGRRNLYNVFDSKVQFLSRFDGLLLKYNYYCFCGDSSLYLYWGGFVVDERVNHYAWITELGWLNICDWCLDLRYSYIDWTKSGRNRCGIRNPLGFDFRNSQFTFGYHFTTPYLESPAKFYGAFLTNHDACKHRVARDRFVCCKLNNGCQPLDRDRVDERQHRRDREHRQECDRLLREECEQLRHLDPADRERHACERLLQLLDSCDRERRERERNHREGHCSLCGQQQCGCCQDSCDTPSRAERRHNLQNRCGNEGNAWYLGCSFGQICGKGDWALDMQYQWVELNSIPNRDVSGIGRGNVLNESVTAVGRGNTNYKGWRLEFLYAFTDNLSLDTIWEHSVAIDKNLGGDHTFSKFELEAIYAF